MDTDDYIPLHCSPEPELQKQVYRNTYLRHLYPRMCCGHVQGRLLDMLTKMLKPMRIIELGTFTGYATLCFADSMPTGAQIHTIEIDDEKEDELKATFALSPRSTDIHLHIGDALEIIPTLPGGWDLALIDANKRLYCEYFEMLVPLMRSGGIILADNTLWGGKICDLSSHNTDPQSVGIMKFNDLVANDPRVETVILPIRDGLTIIRVI